MLNEILWMVLLTFLPFLELRASIPYGIIALGKESWLLVFLVCVITNIILGPILYYFLDFIIKTLTKIKIINNLYQKYIIRIQKRIHRAVEKYGELGIALFIGIPLPGSGVYSGALGSYLLGLSKRKFFYATVIGVLIAGIIVTAVMFTGVSSLEFFIKRLK